MIEKDLNKKWEQGIPHHKESIKIYNILSNADLNYGGDYFCWKYGGDGDNGEILMYALDVYFEVIGIGE